MLGYDVRPPPASHSKRIPFLVLVGAIYSPHHKQHRRHGRNLHTCSASITRTNYSTTYNGPFQLYITVPLHMIFRLEHKETCRIETGVYVLFKQCHMQPWVKECIHGLLLYIFFTSGTHHGNPWIED